MKKLFFALNPYAGTRKANRVLPEILSVFNRADFDVSVYITQGPGDLTAAIARLASHADLVVCCGGDGTFNETITGLLTAGLDKPVGYIPAGSTNDFANSLKLPTDPVAAARLIATGKPEPYDVCRFGSRYFSYVASFGAFTKASYSTPQNVKNALGHTAYLLEGIHELSQIRTSHVALELDGELLEDDYLFGAICNSTSIGGILTLDPNQVDMKDGLFEVLLVRKPHNPLELSDCVLALTTQDYNTPMLTLCSSARVEMESAEELAWSLDGEEAMGGKHTVIENLHSAVDIILNTNTKKSR